MEQQKKTPIIGIKNLSKIFQTKGGEVTALEDFSLDINDGDIYGVIGMSGAGKSTLVRCINALEKPTSGSVIFNGKDLMAISGDELNKTRRSMSMIFQQFNLLSQRNVLSNVCFPLEISGVPKRVAKKKALELLELVGIKDKAKNYPSQLSGGQKQRVAIARALATDPKVLLCDEATSALDPTTTASILSLLKDIHARLGITIVIITHEMGVIEKICSHVAVLEDGHIAESGSVEQIFTHPKSAAARKLVYPDEGMRNRYVGERCIRIVFDGSSSYEPVFSNMILDCNVIVNIMFADMKDIEGKALGHMIVQLPKDELQAEKAIAYLRAKGIPVEEANNEL
ncbi:MAG: ATP-binding cassette domain-containing protein [Oscillospiraceae bacterium]|nr:ATP-binding cassette domain-containing protein [Oscillospiraceae bacterium]